MTFGTVTHKSFVNAWECDENVHLNVQFYWKRFGQAAAIFQHQAGLTQQRWVGRHVRYHAELGMGANTMVRSAVDHYADNFTTKDNMVAEVPEAARPLSLPSTPLSIVDGKEVLCDRNGLLSHLSMIALNECDAEGFLLDENHISRFSDAAGHFWHHLGIDRAWMTEQNLGSVAVEMKITRHALPKVGMITENISWVVQRCCDRFDDGHDGAKSGCFARQFSKSNISRLVFLKFTFKFIKNIGKTTN